MCIRVERYILGYHATCFTCIACHAVCMSPACACTACVPFLLCRPFRVHEHLARGPESDDISLRCVRCKRCSDSDCSNILQSDFGSGAGPIPASAVSHVWISELRVTGLNRKPGHRCPPAHAPGGPTRSAPCRRWDTLRTGTPPERYHPAGLTVTPTTPLENGLRTSYSGV